MTNIPDKLTARRAELLREADENQSHMLALYRDMRVCQARLSEIDFAIAAYGEVEANKPAGLRMEQTVPWRSGQPFNPDAAESPNAEAGAQEAASQATVAAPGAESASAGEFEPATLPAKKPRAPKRSNTVLEFVTAQANQGFDSTQHTIEQIAAALGIKTLTVKKAVAYWQAQERVTLAGGVVLLRTKQSEPSEDGITYGRGGLLAFLQATPDSTMSEINAAGIPFEVVSQAEADGAICWKTGGLYALPEAEAQQSEAAE